MQEHLIHADQGHAFSWIDIYGLEKDEMRKAAEQHGLHVTSLQDVLDPQHLPKFESFENGIFMIVRIYEPATLEANYSVRGLTRKLSLFVKSDSIISFHGNRIDFLDTLKSKWIKKAESEPLTSIFHLLNDILQNAILTFEDALARGQNQLEKLEKATFEQSRAFSNEDAYHVLRAATIVKRMLGMALEVFLRLETLPATSEPFFKDLEENTQRLHFWAGDLLENSNRILNLQLAFSSQRTNEASHRTNETMRVLTILSVFYMPLNLIAGIYGMNFIWMPALDSTHGFSLAIFLMACCSIGSYVWFRSKGWLRGN